MPSSLIVVFNGESVPLIIDEFTQLAVKVPREGEQYGYYKPGQNDIVDIVGANFAKSYAGMEAPIIEHAGSLLLFSISVEQEASIYRPKQHTSR